MKMINIEGVLNPNLNSYNEIIIFFKQYNKEWFKKNNIYFEKHHIIPKSEGGNNQENNLICLPLKYHFLAHYYRGLEFENTDKQKSIKNFIAANFILGYRNNKYNLEEFKKFKDNFPEQIYKIKEKLCLINKDRTYEEIFGNDKAKEIKNKKRGSISRIAVLNIITDELFCSKQEALKQLNITRNKLEKSSEFKFLNYQEYLNKCKELNIEPKLFNLQLRKYQYNKGKKLEDLYDNDTVIKLKEKYAQAAKKRINNNGHPFEGKKRTEEEKQKISNSRKGKGLGTGKIKKHNSFIYIPENKVYTKYMDAVREQNISRSKLMRYLKNKNTDWKYVEA